MNQRHLRKVFRHALPSRDSLRSLTALRQRPGRTRVISGAVVGAAAVAAIVTAQPSGALLADHSNQGVVVEASAAPGQLLPGQLLPGQKSSVLGERDAAAASRGERRTTEGTATPSTTPSAAATPTTKPAPAKMEVDHQFGLQINGYYCGPAASRIAVTAYGVYPTQDEMARRLHTTINGTNSAADITRGLNELVGANTYHTTLLPQQQVTSQQASRLRADVVRAVSSGHPVVVNIAGTAYDVNGAAHSYAGGHYLTVVGYQNSGKQVEIADPAYAVGDGHYWMATTDLADWAGTRGYAS